MRGKAAGVLERRGVVARIRGRLTSDGSLTKKASLNAVAQALDYAARAVAGFVVNPILLRSLGEVGFGNWQVLQRLVGHANPAGGRPAEALKWFLANRQASPDLEDKRRAVGSAVAVWALFLPVLAVAGGVLAWFAPVWLEVPPGLYGLVRIAAAVLVADLVVAGLTNIPWAVMVGQNLGYKRMGLTAALELVGGGLVAAGAIVTRDLVGVALGAVAGTLVIRGTYHWLARTYVPWFGIARPDGAAVRRFVGLSWWFLVWNLVMKVTMGGDIVVLGIAGSASEVATYSLTRFVPITIMAGITSLIFGMAPGLGGLIGAGEVERAARVRNETMATAWLISVVAGAGVLLLGRSFLELWVGPGHYPGTLATLLIALMVIQLTLIRVDSNIIDLTLNIRRKVLLGLGAAAASVALAWYLVARAHLGIVGVTLGFMAGRIVQSLAYPAMIGRILALPARRQLAGFARGALATGALLGGSAALGRAVRVGSWPGLVLASAAAGCVLLGLAFLLGLSAVQRRRLWVRARRVVRLR
ncbi:MAG TPA: lipopolysaccharide biosynthesis protein [Actinomycetota bacterium]|nr:lipopolysaccharide biosynthesis protein [Actinomycetota bacterium]